MEKKNGKGKEYFYNNNYSGNKSYLMFEGEYLNNYRLKGKEYYKNGKLKYEGEFIISKKWNGKVYDELNNIVYELKNGNGKIKEYFENGKLEFEGEYLNGKKKWKRKRI